MAKKRGLDLSPEEAHRMWSASITGKEFGAFAYMFGLGNTAHAIHAKKEDSNLDGENKARRETVAKFLRSWADNLEGK